MTDYAQLEEEIKKIIELVEKLPEPYRATTFEVLLNAHLKGLTPPAETMQPQTESKSQVSEKPDLPIDVKAFLLQYTLPDEAIDKLFFRHRSEIRPIYKIIETKKSTAQKQIALLAALENALKGPDTKFEFSFNQLRTLCQKYDRYDVDNFKNNFRTNKKFFGSLNDEDHIELSPDGKDALADLVADLINEKA